MNRTQVKRVYAALSLALYDAIDTDREAIIRKRIADHLETHKMTRRELNDAFKITLTPEQCQELVGDLMQ